MIVALSVGALISLGIGFWYYAGDPERSDCAVIDEMLEYSESQSEETKDAMSDLLTSPERLIGDYRQRIARLDEFPPRISDQGLRRDAESLNELDSDLIRAWTITAEPTNADSDQETSEFIRAYSLYTAQRGELLHRIETICPGVRR
ncbi:hypothetical protein ACWDUN_09895 [Mycobacterium sp. NPDC003323]